MAASVSISQIPSFTSSQKSSYLNHSASISQLINFSSSSNPIKRLTYRTLSLTQRFASVFPRATASSSYSSSSTTSSTTLHGLCYVVGDNIDTDQIIPAEYLTFFPSNPEEYEKIGSYALIGLPSSYATRFVEPNETKTKYSIVIAGDNFGCGSSREHAPVALGSSEVAAVVAESYSRLFFRNSVSTGEVFPLESEARICEECKTGDVVTIELNEIQLINHTTGKEYKLKPIGDAGPVVEAGGIFSYARKTGMIPSHST